MVRSSWGIAAVVAGVVSVALIGGMVANAQGQPSGPVWVPASSAMVPARRPLVQGYDADQTYAWFTDGKRVVVCSKRTDNKPIHCSSSQTLP